ncbi:MAG: hypothetical protein RI957_1936 [Verrucomicrobiota bacterium]|jgi:hypothetical protein
MKDSDEEELHRLCDMLKKVDEMLHADSPLREAVMKGALALSITFADGSRAKLESIALGTGKPLTETQRTYLGKMGIDLGEQNHPNETAVMSQFIVVDSSVPPHQL